MIGCPTCNQIMPPNVRICPRCTTDVLQYYIYAYQQQMMIYQQYLQYVQYIQYQQYLQQLQFQYNQGRPQVGHYAPFAVQEQPQSYSQSYQPYSPYGQYYGIQPPQMPEKMDIVEFYKPPARLALPSETEEREGGGGGYSYQYDPRPTAGIASAMPPRASSFDEETGRGFTVEEEIEPEEFDYVYEAPVRESPSAEGSGGPQWGESLKYDDGGVTAAEEVEATLVPESEVVGETYPEDDYPVLEELPEVPNREEDILEVICFACENGIPIYTDLRPLLITCPHCGQEGQID